MKKLIMIVTIAAMMISVTGCISVNWGGGQDVIVGKGEIVTKNYPMSELGEFTKVAINMQSKLYLIQGETDEVRIELHENLVEHMNVTNSYGILNIGSVKNLRTNRNDRNTPRIYITCRTLEALAINGVVEFSETDTITAESFSLDLAGVSSGKLNLHVKDLNVDISGVGDLTLTGTAGKARIDSSGVGNLDAFGLTIKEADVGLSGVGSVDISCEEHLKINLSGLGSIRYKGNPEISQNKSGLGSITKVND